MTRVNAIRPIHVSEFYCRLVNQFVATREKRRVSKNSANQL